MLHDTQLATASPSYLPARSGPRFRCRESSDGGLDRHGGLDRDGDAGREIRAKKLKNAAGGHRSCERRLGR